MNKPDSSPNDKSVEFLCSTVIGRLLLRIILFLQIPKALGFFLRTPFSRFMISNFVKKNGIDMSEFAGQKYCCFNDFFTRKKNITFDPEVSHLISPCDCLLSVFPIEENSVFSVKGFDYKIEEFLEKAQKKEPENVEKSENVDKFTKGLCLIFRLCATDYHRYCYIDNGIQGENHFIPGSLYSVQPAACENFRVYTKNRRSWTILETENFGSVAQIEVGAFSVGGIVNHHSNYKFTKGEEKGYFDLHGSTIVLLFQENKINLLPEILNSADENGEIRVKAGQWIGNAQ